MKNAADLIYWEAKQLPETLVCGSTGFHRLSALKACHRVAPEEPAGEAQAELDAFFATHQRDLSHFRFDREEGAGS